VPVTNNVNHLKNSCKTLDEICLLGVFMLVAVSLCAHCFKDYHLTKNITNCKHSFNRTADSMQKTDLEVVIHNVLCCISKGL